MKKRRFLQWAVSCGAANALPLSSLAQQPSAAVVLPLAGSLSFPWGVASGAPLAGGVVLWTRLAGLGGEALAGPVAVSWWVWPAGQPQQVVAQGRVTPSAEWGYAVHAEVSGLQSDQWYEYRFSVEGVQSAVGRTRTLPAPGSQTAHWRLAYASCQRWEDGHYAAYRHMRADAPDMVVFLGDYIYEYASRRPNVAVRTHSLRHARSLNDYRARYALYRSDPDLQAMHAACPWLVTWDDHEVENNYAALLSTEGTPDLTAQRLAAYQAFYEFMPIRRSAWQRGLASMRAGEPLRIHQRVDLGQLASIHLLDNRQYREPPLCVDKPSEKLSRVCMAEPSGQRSMLGLEQEAWLAQGLQASAAMGQRWNVLAQQTCFSPRNVAHGAGQRFSTDSWDGYPEARQRLLDALVASRAQNPVFLGGDIHQNWVAHVHAKPYDLRSPVVASEFVGTSISSNGAEQSVTDRRVAQNPHCLLGDSAHRGYGLVDMSPTSFDVRLRVLADVKDPESTVRDLARFRVRAGRPRIHREA
jgi:alkaline phosphatase D